MTGDMRISIGQIQLNLDELIGDTSGLYTQLSTTVENLSTLEIQYNSIQNQINDIQNSPEIGVQVVSELEPSIVKIISRGDGFISGGTGIIINSAGYVLTNNHVVAETHSFTVTLFDNTLFDASVIAQDAERDLAILKINSFLNDFKPARLGSITAVRIGEEVYAMGFPLLFDLPGQGTYTRGIVSAVRELDGFTWVQTDAAINPGNSGGALVNISGEVIGINTLRIVSGEDGTPIDNVAFAIPIDDAFALISQVIGG